VSLMRACLGVPGKRCGRLIATGSRCPECKYLYQRNLDLMRGTPAQRGYDRAYRRLRLEVLAESGGLCYWCGRPGADTADHLIPTSRGGSSERDNLVAAHRGCNSARGGRMAKRVGGMIDTHDASA
jgi:5-methylcytosine-specific restriction endonuclease McrA